MGAGSPRGRGSVRSTHRDAAARKVAVGPAGAIPTRVPPPTTVQHLGDPLTDHPHVPGPAHQPGPGVPPPQPQPGAYPPAPGAYPPAQGGYPPAAAYPPAQGGYPGAPGPYQAAGQEGWAAAPVPPVPPARRSRKGLVVGGSVVGGLLLLGGAGAWAYTAIDGGGAQPEEALPASTIGYVRVDLDPSAAQKINLVRLADRVPDLAAELDVELDEDTDLKQLLAEALTRSGECEIDYAQDVQPWIGDRAAVAAIPGADEPSPVVVLAVTDEGAARSALESGLGCGDGVAAEQVAFAAGYAVVTDEGVSAADVVADAGKSSLADDDVFVADMKALGDPGLVSFWADTEAVASLVEEGADALGEDVPGAADLAALEDYTSVTGALRAGPDHLELTMLTAAGDDVLAPYDATGRAATADLPGTTLAAVAFSVDSAAVDDAWRRLAELADTYGDLGGADAFEMSHEISLGTTASTAGGLGLDVAPDGVDQETYDFCLEAAQEYDLGLDGYDFTDQERAEYEQMYLDSFMEGCTGVPTTTGTATDGLSGSTDVGDVATDELGTDDPWGGSTDVDDPWGGSSSAEAPTFDDTVALLAEEYDLHLPEDLKTLLGEQVVVAVDAGGLADAASITGLEDVSVGLRTVGDAAALQDLADRLDALVVDAGGEPLATAETGDGHVFATNDGYASALAAGGDLGSSEAYRSVVDDDGASSVLFVDLDRLTDVLRANLEGEDADGLSALEPLRAVGLTTSVDGGHARFALKLSFD